jgi:hypothetical protein
MPRDVRVALEAASCEILVCCAEDATYIEEKPAASLGFLSAALQVLQVRITLEEVALDGYRSRIGEPARQP